MGGRMGMADRVRMGDHTGMADRMRMADGSPQAAGDKRMTDDVPPAAIRGGR